ncbi:VanZ family protein [Nocardioides limicola]|uniref:VanZ family protein n=1 Tax=Nocardioides limicola TaxID=2803368 RepID=UPI00193B9B20|nr:VanZ family protein [Nocardioides sp. DJM-14]
MLHRHPFLALVTGGYLAFVGWLTLSPVDSITGATSFGIRVLDALQRRGHLTQIDHQQFEFLANVGLFVPAGMFLALLFGSRYWWVALFACVAMTGGIEWAQQHIPGRVPDPRDLVANSLGAAVGVIVALILMLPATLRRARVRRARERRTGQRADPARV